MALRTWDVVAIDCGVVWWFVVIFVHVCRIRLEGIQVELDAPLQFKVLSILSCLLCIHASLPFLSLPPSPPLPLPLLPLSYYMWQHATSA